MTMSVTAVRRGLVGAFATCALGGVAAATIAIPSAAAQPGCSASDFSRTASGVLADGGWVVGRASGSQRRAVGGGYAGSGC